MPSGRVRSPCKKSAPGHGNSLLTEIRIKGSTFCTEAMAFLGDRWDISSIALVNSLLVGVQARCPKLPNMTSHSTFWGSVNAAIDSVSTLSWLMSGLIDTVSDNVGDVRELDPWPTTLADLIPLGINNFVHAQLMRQQYQNDGTPYALLTAVLKVDGLTTPKMFFPALKRWRALFTLDFPARLHNSSKDLLRHGADSFSHKAAFMFVYRLIVCLTEPMALESAELREIFAGYEDSLTQALEPAAFDAIEKLAMAEKHEEARRRLKFVMNANMSRFMLQATGRRWQGADWCPTHLTAACKALLIKMRQRSTRCDEPNCLREHGDDDGAIAIQKCSRCKAFRYCSTECQRAHWSSATRPHKTVCKLFQALGQIASFDMDPDLFGRACVAGGITTEQLVLLAYHLECVRDRMPNHSPKEMLKAQRAAKKNLSSATKAFEDTGCYH
ncbi:hypothetical protein BKA62DRAFT_828389 [Auriculariales sp. MPI-PUGE-AT-0066]|nr:hypothetical protein BKA62DRAFT_828389 [Auriculariales sp. MPI-PUGE-AT-0066]